MDNFLKKYFGSMIFSCLGIVAIPNFFYISNISEFNQDIFLLLIPSIVAVFAFIVSAALPLRRHVQLCLAGFGISIFLCDLLLRADIGRLDGASASIPIDMATALPNAFIYFGLPLALLMSGARAVSTLVNLAFVSVFLAFGVTAYSGGISMLGAAGHAGERVLSPPRASDSAVPLSQKPNVYFIWLDALETGYLRRYLAEERNASAFPGFTFFVNNSSNYLYTLQSYASFMSGTVYKGGPYQVWSDKGMNLRKVLSSVGYRTTSYAKRDFLSSLDNVAYSSEEIFLEATKSRHPYIADFVTYWMVRSLPTLIANESLQFSRTVGHVVHGWVNPRSVYTDVKTISDGIEPVSGVLVLRQFVADEASRSDFNEFVITHAVIPHGPYVIDADCKYRGRASKAPKDAYYDQLVCAADLVEDFLHELKRLNRYDSSMIIIMGDHGSGWAGLIEGVSDGTAPLNGKFTPWSKSMVLSRASAALMIKPPKPRGPVARNMTISPRESQLTDIYPTILSMIGQEARITEDVVGENIFGHDVSVRDKSILYFRPSRVIDTDEAEIYDLTISPDGGLADILFRSRFRDPSKILTVECGQLIQFSNASRDANYYSAEGLSGFETHGRWSDGGKVVIKFRLPQTRCTDSTITLRLHGFVSDLYPLQSGNVELNGSELGRLEIRAGEASPVKFAFELSAPVARWGQINELTFDVDQPVSPKNLGMSEDRRLLGFGFQTLEIR